MCAEAVLYSPGKSKSFGLMGLWRDSAAQALSVILLMCSCPQCCYQTTTRPIGSVNKRVEANRLSKWALSWNSWNSWYLLYCPEMSWNPQSVLKFVHLLTICPETAKWLTFSDCRLDFYKQKNHTNCSSFCGSALDPAWWAYSAPPQP